MPRMAKHTAGYINYDYDGKQRSVCEIDRINRKSVAYNCYDMLANRVVG